MDPDKQARLDRHRPALIRDMDAMPVVDYLIAASIFNDHHAKEIEKLQDSEDKSRRLLKILKTKGTEAFHQLLVALRASNQHYLATLLDGQKHAEELQQVQKITQESLKQKYLVKFRYVYPFSLPFTFDIENTWVSLALKEDSKDSQATEDHAKLLERAFEKAKMLIIEGGPASGKTSLMRKLAYEWAKEPLHYDLVVYAEFRRVREKSFTSITDLVLGCSKEYLESEEFDRLALLLSNKQFCTEHSILVLLDGYDESSLDKQCFELQKYLFDSVINKPLLFNIVITTRKGYLSNLRGYKGRFIYADVLGFTTDEQKKKYISNHFTSGANSRGNITSVHHLLGKNRNLDKLTETPLFLTFICLVHERIIDGTLVELYCSILWWLIDRHQKDFPERNIPNLLGFKTDTSSFTTRLQRNSTNKEQFKAIQDHYLEFTQLHCLGKMALKNLEQSTFQQSDFHQFNLTPTIEQVGLLIKDEFYDKSFRLTTTFSFPHRTIQEFLAALYYFNSDETDQMLSKNSIMDTYRMTEYEKFLLRIALSKRMAINKTKRTIYLERIKRITNLTLDLTFDAFNTPAGLSNELLNEFISPCTNIQILQYNDSTHSNEPQISVQILSFTNLRNLSSMSFHICIFEANSQISFENCPSMKHLKFCNCEIKSSATIDFSKLSALNTLEFGGCTIDLKAWQSLTDGIERSFVKLLKLTFRKDFSNEIFNHLQKCNNVEKIEITIRVYKITTENSLLSLNDLTNLRSLTFWYCTIEANSLLLFTNGPSLKTLQFSDCEIKISATIDLSNLPALDTLEFWRCIIDLKAWQSITDGITRSFVKLLKLTFWKDFNDEIFNYLQKCNNVEKIEITIREYNIAKENLLSLNDLINLHSLIFWYCTIEASSQISFTNCPSLKTLQFSDCEIKISATIDLSNLPALDTLEFWRCTIDLKAWQSITEGITRSFVKLLKLIFEKDFSNEILNHLQKCNNVEKIEITIREYNISKENLLSLNDLINLHSLNLVISSFEANSLLLFTYGPSLKTLQFTACQIKSNARIDFSKLPALNTLEFWRCVTDLKAWQSITDEITRSSVKQLKLSSDFFKKEENSEFFVQLQKCECIDKIEVINENHISNEEQLTINLSNLARKMKGLKRITFESRGKRMKDTNIKIIMKAGQERDPAFEI